MKEVTRLKNFIAWVKILRPKYKRWFWHALKNSKTHYADEESWPQAEGIHKNKH